MRHRGLFYARKVADIPSHRLAAIAAPECRDQVLLSWTEKQFQQQIVGLARLLGWWVYHPYDSRRSTPGYPDLTLVHPRHGIIWRELKTQKGPVSRHQREAIALIEQAGGDVAIWRPSQWADLTIHDTLNPGGLHR